MADNDIDICFPIIKFSHATGLIDNQIPWDHISGKSLDVLIQGSSSPGRSLTLRVIQGTKDLVRGRPLYFDNYETDED